MSSSEIIFRKKRAYDRLRKEIRRQIIDGTLGVDEFLLPERELAKRYGISSRSVREGLAGLEAEGLILRHQGRGTKVVHPVQQKMAPSLTNVAVIFQGRVRDTSTAEEFDALQQAFQSEGYGMTLYVADQDPEKEAGIVKQLAAASVPGLVLYSAHPVDSSTHLRAALDAGMKIAVLDHDFPDLDCNFVGIDDRQAGFDASEHLVRLGCSQLLMINSQRNWTTHALREQGFEEAAEKHGVARSVLRLPYAHTTMQYKGLILQGLSSIARQANRTLGIVAWWDEIALLAVECLKELGWSVPHDAAVVGFANDRRGETADIPLTTMAFPRKEMAALAAAAVVGQMRNPGRPSQRIRLKVRMIIRESCGTYQRGRDMNRTPVNTKFVSEVSASIT